MVATETKPGQCPKCGFPKDHERHDYERARWAGWRYCNGIPAEVVPIGGDVDAD